MAGTSGLANLGNTCYINTAIQCLGYCPEFRQFILDTSHATSHNLAAEMHELYHEMWVHNFSIIPKKFIRYLKDTITCINITEQNDINEFLSLIIDKLNQHISQKITVTRDDLIKKNKYKNTEFDLQRFKMDLSWYEKVSKEYSALIPMLHGQSISQIQCGNCSKIFHNYEIYLNLMLPLTQSTKNIYDCLDEYFKEEKITFWTCDGCHKQSPSSKVVKLWRNPNILIVSLKRFTLDLQKNNRPIIMPEELDMSKYTLTKGANIYKLQAVAHHDGSFDSGHYQAICSMNDQWYVCDDLMVKQIDKPNLDFGYVYFYARS